MVRGPVIVLALVETPMNDAFVGFERVPFAKVHGVNAGAASGCASTGP